MNKVIGFLMMAGGVAFGLYAGIWWAFVGGVVQVIGAFQAAPVDSVNVGLGVLRVICALLIGQLAAIPLIAAGYAVADQD